MKEKATSTVLSWALVALGAVVVLESPTNAQSAWTQPEGGAFLQVSLQRTGPYDTLFRSSGSDFETGREITESALEAYAEYGLSNSLTLIGVLPVRYQEAGRLESGATVLPTTIESGTQTTVGNVLLGVRKKLVSGSYDVAAQLGVEFPTGSLDRRTGLSSGIDAFTLLPTVSVGRGAGRAYVQGYAGFGLRTNDYSHDWRGGVESGYRFDRVLIAGTFDIVDIFSSGDFMEDARNLQTGLYVDEQEYASYGIKGLYEVSESFGIQGAYRSALSGNNVARASFMTVGVYLRWPTLERVPVE